MESSRTTKGFTFVEIIVVIAIIAVIVGISASAFKNMSRASALKIATEEVHSALSGARAKTLASEGDTVYGVHIATSSVTRYTGNTYTAGDPSNRVYDFEYGVTATGALAISGTNVLFSRLTGASSASGTIVLRLDDGSATSTIRINASGLIEY